MQEQKRVFLKGKMNKDLDDRIVPNGEYRDAQNVVIATSEGSDVGTVQTILGNTAQIEGIIGDPIYALPDHNNDKIYVWTTSGLFQLYKNPRPLTANFPFLSIQLLSGSYLNFLASSIFQANILENYLYWVDGVNQPRVIDIDKAVSSALANTPYYTNEDHISVAKYNPYKVMRSIRRIETIFDSISTNVITVDDATGIAVGDYVLNWTAYEFLGIVEAVAGSDITLDRTPISPTPDDELYIYQSTQTDESSDPQWEGDPDFLEDKFVRFSYRYKYDDDTYSLIAPYTQPIYKPKQGGYFAYDAVENIDDERKALKSTIVKFMENAINNVEFYVPLPSNQPAVDYKIKEVEIIFTESDKFSAQIVETIPVEKITVENDYALDGAYFKYEYRSTIPYKTVTQQDYIRVSDQIPILARAQAIASNRVMYGNFDTKLDAPESINFSVGADEKSGKEEIHAEYQNHTVKQDRNYQIGIVLKDKYGRSSGVISSDFLNEVTTTVSQSTEYHAYKGSGWNPGVKNWLGDSLKVNLYDKIPSVNLYAAEQGFFNYKRDTALVFGEQTGQLGEQLYYIAIPVATSGDTDGLTSTANQLSTINYSPGDELYLRGKYKDYVKIYNVEAGNQGGIDYTIIFTYDPVSEEHYKASAFLEDFQTFKLYSINHLGWYTYTVVAKQLEHDYYNVYLPDLINGTLFYDESGGGGSVHWVDTDADQAVTFPLYSDNINKVPRDLNEVGPDQEQYRSNSILLSGRVTNTYDIGTTTLGNSQYFPGRIKHEINRIGTLKELFANTEDDGPYNGNISQIQAISNANSNPLIAVGEISNSPIGIELQYINADDFNLSVYETEPVKSVLEIYYESATTGLISDINYLVENSTTGPVRITDVTATLNENQDLQVALQISNLFQVENIQGADITPTSYGIESVVNQEGTVVSNDLFELSLTGQDFIIKATSLAEFEYTRQSSLLDTYTINMFFTKDDQTLNASATVTPLNAPPNRSLWIPNNATADPSVPATVQIDSDTGAGDGNFTDTIAVGETNVFSVRLHNGSIKYDGTSKMPSTDVILEAENIQVEGEQLSLTLPNDISWATEVELGGQLSIGSGFQIISNNLDNAVVSPVADDRSKGIEVILTNTDQLASTTFRHQLRDIDEVNYGGAIEGTYDTSLTPSEGNVKIGPIQIWKSNEKDQDDNYTYPWGGSNTKSFRFSSFFYNFDAADEGKTFEVEYIIRHYSTRSTTEEISNEDIILDWFFVEDVEKMQSIKGSVTVVETTDSNGDPEYRARFDQVYTINFTAEYDNSNSNYTVAYLKPTNDTQFVKDFQYSLDWKVKDVNGEGSESEEVSGTYTFTAIADSSPNQPNINLYFPDYPGQPNPSNPATIVLQRGDQTDFSIPDGASYRFDASNSVGAEVTNKVIVTGYPNSRYEAGVVGAIQNDDMFYPNAENETYTVRYNIPASEDPNGLAPTERTREIFIENSSSAPTNVNINGVILEFETQGSVSKPFIDGPVSAISSGNITRFEFWYKFPNIPGYTEYTQLTDTNVLTFFDDPKGTLGQQHYAHVVNWKPRETNTLFQGWEQVDIKLIAFSDNLDENGDPTFAIDEKTINRPLV